MEEAGSKRRGGRTTEERDDSFGGEIGDRKHNSSVSRILYASMREAQSKVPEIVPAANQPRAFKRRTETTRDQKTK